VTLRIPLPWWQADTRVEIRLRLLLGLLPAWIFLGVSRFAPPWAAIGSGFVATLAVYERTDRNRFVGGLAAFALAVVAIASVVGIAWSDEKAYLASGVATDLLFVPAYLVSALIRRPFVGGIAREMVPTIAGVLPLDHAVYRLLTFAWAIYYAAHGLVQWWLLRELSVAQFVIISRVILWPPTGLALLLTAGVIWRAAKRRQTAGDATASISRP
jgi:intracellular septation protein A